MTEMSGPSRKNVKVFFLEMGVLIVGLLFLRDGLSFILRIPHTFPPLEISFFGNLKADEQHFTVGMWELLVGLSLVVGVCKKRAVFLVPFFAVEFLGVVVEILRRLISQDGPNGYQATSEEKLTLDFLIFFLRLFSVLVVATYFVMLLEDRAIIAGQSMSKTNPITNRDAPPPYQSPPTYQAALSLNQVAPPPYQVAPSLNQAVSPPYQDPSIHQTASSEAASSTELYCTSTQTILELSTD